MLEYEIRFQIYIFILILFSVSRVIDPLNINIQKFPVYIQDGGICLMSVRIHYWITT